MTSLYSLRPSRPNFVAPAGFAAVHAGPDRTGIAHPLMAAVGLWAAAMAVGAAFAGWSANGPALLDALSRGGLVWCL